MAFLFLKNQFQLDEVKYQSIVERNRNNRIKGLKKDFPNQPLVSKLTDNENEIDIEKENENEINTKKNLLIPLSEIINQKPTLQKPFKKILENWSPSKKMLKCCKKLGFQSDFMEKVRVHYIKTCNMRGFGSIENDSGFISFFKRELIEKFQEEKVSSLEEKVNETIEIIKKEVL